MDMDTMYTMYTMFIEPLFADAAADGNVAVLRFLSARHTDPMLKSRVYRCAAVHARINVIRYMLAKHPGEGFGGDLKELGEVFDFAAEKGDLATIQLLSEHYPDAARSCAAVGSAIMNEHWGVVEWMVDNGVGVHTDSVLVHVKDLDRHRWLRQKFPEAPITPRCMQNLLDAHAHDVLDALSAEFPQGLPVDDKVNLDDHPAHLRDWLGKCMALMEAECPVCLELTPAPRTTCNHVLCWTCYRGTVKLTGKRCPMCRAELQMVYH